VITVVDRWNVIDTYLNVTGLCVGCLCCTDVDVLGCEHMFQLETRINIQFIQLNLLLTINKIP